MGHDGLSQRLVRLDEQVLGQHWPVRHTPLVLHRRTPRQVKFDP